MLLAAGALRARGARNVLVTLGARGALLLRQDGSVLRQEAVAPPSGAVVDTTAAGDAFRAAFAVALVAGRPLQECLRFAAAAGALAVSRLGAMPSLPRRDETERLAGFPIGGQPGGGTCSGGPAAECSAADAPLAEAQPTAAPAGSAELPPLECPYQFASRLNSMRARRDLAGWRDGGDDVAGWIKRQSRVKGLGLVDLNHPQVGRTAGLLTHRRSLLAVERAEAGNAFAAGHSHRPMTTNRATTSSSMCGPAPIANRTELPGHVPVHCLPAPLPLQHTAELRTPKKTRAVLEGAGLAAGAICM